MKDPSTPPDEPASSRIQPASSSASSSSSSSASNAFDFPHTRYTLVSDAAKDREKLEELLRLYRKPLLNYARFMLKARPSGQDPEDLLQDYLQHLVKRDYIREFRRDHGGEGPSKFRKFLKQDFQLFASNQWRKEKRRRDPETELPDDHDMGGKADLSDKETPEDDFDFHCARSILETAAERLGEICDQFEPERAAIAKVLIPDFLEGLIPTSSIKTEEARESYREMADRLGTTEGAIKQHKKRLKDLWRDILRGVVADTLFDPTPATVGEELRFLVAALAKKS